MNMDQLVLAGRVGGQDTGASSAASSSPLGEIKGIAADWDLKTQFVMKADTFAGHAVNSFFQGANITSVSDPGSMLAGFNPPSTPAVNNLPGVVSGRGGGG
jgi:hypothetical protein